MERIIEKTLFCESGHWIERISIAIALATVGVLLIIAALPLPPGPIRGFVLWLLVTLFFAKACNLFTCGGPIPSAIHGVLVAFIIEVMYFLHAVKAGGFDAQQ